MGKMQSSSRSGGHAPVPEVTDESPLEAVTFDSVMRKTAERYQTAVGKLLHIDPSDKRALRQAGMEYGEAWGDGGESLEASLGSLGLLRNWKGKEFPQAVVDVLVRYVPAYKIAIERLEERIAGVLAIDKADKAAVREGTRAYVEVCGAADHVGKGILNGLRYMHLLDEAEPYVDPPEEVFRFLEQRAPRFVLSEETLAKVRAAADARLAEGSARRKSRRN